MPLMLQIIAACLLGGLLSLLAAGLILFGLPKKWIPYAVSFSIGILLATSMLHLMPEAMASGITPSEAFAVMLGGLLFFFILEKLAIWRHEHNHNGLEGQDAAHEAQPHQSQSHGALTGHAHSHHHAHGPPGGTISILLGDGVHNFTDGLLIAAAFLTDPALGWLTTFAVIAHEIPQEAGDFAILLSAGWSRKRAFMWNGLSSLASVAGGVIGYFTLDYAQDWLPYIVIIAAASFLYVAISDLLPRLKFEQRGLGWHGLLLAVGIAAALL